MGGRSNDLLGVKLDVTRRADAEAAVRVAVDRFGHPAQDRPKHGLHSRS
jgi:hypothetical protein